jgi:hypothetical protein
MHRHIPILLWGVFCFTMTMFACSNASDGQQHSGIAFMRVMEPREAAFSILVPRGWQSQGGIFRVNAAQAGGPLNAMEAKCDLLFKSDARGTVAFRILPDIVYAHVGIGGGFWPPGSSYQGAVVRPFEDAVTHLNTIFTNLHANTSSPTIVKMLRLPGEIKSMEKGLSYTNQLFASIGLGHMRFQCDAAGGMFDYMEDGVQYREVLLTGIVDMRAALTWKNSRTLAFRAPASEFKKWRPVFDIMRGSVKFNPRWILSESKGQQQRAKIVTQVFNEIRRIDQEIVRHTTINREEIMNDNYLVLTGQEEYVNPHTHEVETDTDAYRYRWTNANGDVYYTDLESEDPNTFLHKTDYLRTPVRKRRNE